MFSTDGTGKGRHCDKMDHQVFQFCYSSFSLLAIFTNYRKIAILLYDMLFIGVLQISLMQINLIIIMCLQPPPHPPHPHPVELIRTGWLGQRICLPDFSLVWGNKPSKCSGSNSRDVHPLYCRRCYASIGCKARCLIVSVMLFGAL